MLSGKQSALKVVSFDQPVQQVHQVSFAVLFDQRFVWEVLVSSWFLIPYLLEDKTVFTAQAVTMLNICRNSWYPNVICRLQSCNFIVKEKGIVVLELPGHLLDSKHPCSPLPVVSANTATVGCCPPV